MMKIFKSDIKFCVIFDSVVRQEKVKMRSSTTKTTTTIVFPITPDA